MKISFDELGGGEAKGFLNETSRALVAATSRIAMVLFGRHRQQRRQRSLSFFLRTRTRLDGETKWSYVTTLVDGSCIFRLI